MTKNRASCLLAILAFVLGLWALSGSAAQATCSTSSNRVDDPNTADNENSDDIFWLRHGLVPAFGTDTLYAGGDGNDASYVGVTRNGPGAGHVEASGGSGRLKVHGATSDHSANWSASLSWSPNGGACVNDRQIP